MSINTLRLIGLFVIIPLSQGSAILSTNQRTARSCWHPFRRLSTPTEEYCETSTAQYGSFRVTSTFGSGNLIRAATLQTEPTRTPWWKCAINDLFVGGEIGGTVSLLALLLQVRKWSGRGMQAIVPAGLDNESHLTHPLQSRLLTPPP